MAARGHIPFEGRGIQGPGMMRHGVFPGVGPNHRSLDPLPPVDILEKKVSMQAAEMECLARENQRLAATHVTLRQDLVATQQEMQRVQAHIGGMRAESDAQISGLLDKITKMEADLRAGENIKKELQEAHLEAKSLVANRQELNAEVQKLTLDLQKARADLKNLPEMHAELESLRKEHQRLRTSFEYEKGLNIEQVEQMRAMERNLLSMAREVEKLRAEVLNAEKRVHATQYMSTYGSSDPAHSNMTPGGGPAVHVDSYGRPQVQVNSGPSTEAYGRAVAQPPVDAYGRSHVQMTGGVPVDAYGRPAVHMSGSIPVDAYGRPQIPANGAVPVEGMSPYGSGGGPVRGGWGGANEAGTGAPPAHQW